MLFIEKMIGTTRWTRFKGRHWFPIVDVHHDPRRSMKMQWFFKAFINGTYPSDLFPEISGGFDPDVFEDLLPPELFAEDEEAESTDWSVEDEDEDESDWDSNEDDDDETEVD